MVPLTSGLAFQCSRMAKISTSNDSIAICRGCERIRRGSANERQRGKDRQSMETGLQGGSQFKIDEAMQSQFTPHPHRHPDIVELHICAICSERSQAHVSRRLGNWSKEAKPFPPGRLSLSLAKTKKDSVGRLPPLSCSYTWYKFFLSTASTSRQFLDMMGSSARPCR